MRLSPFESAVAVIALLRGALGADDAAGSYLVLDMEMESPNGAASLAEQKALFDRIKERLAEEISRSEAAQSEYAGPAGSEETATSEQNARAREAKSDRPSAIRKMVGLLHSLSDRQQASALAPQTADKPEPTVLEYNDDILNIATDKNIFLTIANNISSIGKLGAPVEPGIATRLSVYQGGQPGKLVDYWGVLAFESKDGRPIDTTGQFQGVLKPSWDNLLETSRMSRTGFFIDKDTSELDERLMVYKLKKLIVKIAYFRKMTVPSLMAQNKQLGLLESIIFANNYPLKQNDTVRVCVCEDDNCKKPCTEVRRITRKNFL
ncbi:hypothetical protein PAPHI01_1263 [Pancytospora philotis]|nr:hypothetical protein PAPHI01_1263 [Pancytospora philotis]